MSERVERVERVARSIFEEDRPDDSYDRFVDYSGNPQKYVRMARAAIEAMCNPNEGMVKAGATAQARFDPRFESDNAADIFEAMIDAALAPAISNPVENTEPGE